MDCQQGLLDDIVSKLVVDQLLHDEVDSLLQADLVTQLPHDLVVVLRELAFEDVLDVRLLPYSNRLV